MNRRSLFAVPLLVVSALASEAAYAAPAAVRAPIHAMFGKAKMVKFTLRNDGSAPLMLKVGDETMTLDAGKSKVMELPIGTRIMRQDATALQPAGTVVTEVSKELSGVTLALKG